MIVVMKDFKKYTNNKTYGGSNSRFSGETKPSYHKSDMTMYEATCSECGNACQVPFRPVGSKPVKCRNCFVDKREGQDYTFSNKYSQERREGGATSNHKTNSSARNFSNPEAATLSAVDQKAISDMKVQIDSLHTKINSIMELLNK